MMTIRYTAILLVAASIAVPASGAAQDPAPAPAAAPTPADSQPRVATQPPAQLAVLAVPAYTPHRVYDTKRRRFIDLETLIARISRDADVAYLGEFHNDPGTHVLQAGILDGIARRRNGQVVLSLEMFERDVQSRLDAYLADSIAESAFLASSRPWGNYRSDYRPMVELAKSRAWPVVGGNVPRRLASVVARRGLVALDSLPEGDRPFVAAEHSCPRNEYWERFRETMGDMSGHGMQLTPDQVEAMVWRTYEAQCVKDEAMAESIVQARATHRTLVVHANGAFHSNHHLGTVERVQRRDRRARQVVVTFLPVADLDTADGRAQRKIGDYIVFTLAPAAAEPAP